MPAKQRARLNESQTVVKMYVYVEGICASFVLSWLNESQTVVKMYVNVDIRGYRKMIFLSCYMS